jgi:hypothetical protein
MVNGGRDRCALDVTVPQTYPQPGRCVLSFQDLEGLRRLRERPLPVNGEHGSGVSPGAGHTTACRRCRARAPSATPRPPLV